MAAAAAPDIVLLDEPAAGLNVADIELLREDLEALKRAGVTVCIALRGAGLRMVVIARDRFRQISEGERRSIRRSACTPSPTMSRESRDGCARRAN